MVLTQAPKRFPSARFVFFQTFLGIFVLATQLAAQPVVQSHADQFGAPAFICKSGDRLSNWSLLCDGRSDCYDASDESVALCAHTVCPETKFKCFHGACIDRRRKCDGIRDCHDGSDERNCGRKLNSCATNEFRCAHTAHWGQHHCISASKICDGFNDCADASDESHVLCDHQLCPADSFRCQFGGCVAASVQCDGFNDCIDGSDESTVLCLARDCPKCRQSIRCPPLLTQAVASARIDAMCTYNDEAVPCTGPMRPGTKATYTCKEYNLPDGRKHENNNWNLCQQDGTWLRDVLKCQPDCGHLSNVVPLVMNGWELSVPLPWHASLYVNFNANGDGNQSVPSFICGATLISEAAVITAAHCVWDLQPNQFAIGLGNTRIHYNNSADRFVVYYKARNIIMHPLYLDKYGNYGSDIALIEIRGNVQFTEYIRPICIDWHLDDITSHLADQSLGIGTGLGLTENMRYSDELRALTMPVISNQKCAAKQKADFQKYITFTTFCAGWANGSAVCNGDSGGGLIFPMKRNPDKWCLQGIVSLSPRRASTAFCDPEQYTIFTKVGIYVKWIRNTLAQIHEKHNIGIDKIQEGPVF